MVGFHSAKEEGCMLYALIVILCVGPILVSTLFVYAACVVAARTENESCYNDIEILHRVHQQHVTNAQTAKLKELAIISS